MANWLQEQERIAREHHQAGRSAEALQLIEALIANGYDFEHSRALRRDIRAAMGMDPETGAAGAASEPARARESLKLLVSRSAADPASKWPHRTEGNRLEPECWPEIRPSFTIPPKAVVFTIGSCFARNVEHHLDRLGFVVPTKEFLRAHPERFGLNDDNFLNRYTPPSMSQELAWARSIEAKGGVVELADVEKYFLPVPGGGFIDLQQRSLNRGGRPVEDLVAERQLFYDLTRQAFDADVVILTLGLIECWFDNHLGEFVEFNVAMLGKEHKDRFEFRRLKYEACYAHVKQALDLLNSRGPKKVLITTSPIPLQRTFSGEDAITANTYSKAVLRAVAGAIAEDHPEVDYFPSFESATLTRKNDIWKDDLVHVQPSFISSIISRVVRSYVGAAHDQDEAEQFIQLSAEGQETVALALYDRMRDTGAIPTSLEFLAWAANLLLMAERRDDAQECLDMARPMVLSDPQAKAASLVRWALVARSLGEHELAANFMAKIMQAADRITAVRGYFTGLAQLKRAEDVAWLLDFVERHMADQRELLVNLGMTAENHGLYDEAERALRLALLHDSESEPVVARLGAILFRQKRDADAIEFLERANRLNPSDPHALGNLTLALLRLERYDEAAEAAGRLVALDDTNPYGHFYLARASIRLGRTDEALAQARAALEHRARAPVPFVASIETFIAAAERRQQEAGSDAAQSRAQAVGVTA